MAQPLKYLPFETVVDTAFWHVLAKKKLNDFRLSQGPFSVTAEYTNSLADKINPRVIIDASSFPDFEVKKYCSAYKLHGQLTVVNSLDDFKSLEKQSFINQYGRLIMQEALLNMEYLKNPELLLAFQLLTYCDLKRHKFYFWFAYPAAICDIQPLLLSYRLLDEEFSGKQLSEFQRSYEEWRKEHTSAFFVVRTETETGDHVVSISSYADFTLEDPGIYLAFCDPSTHSSFPGWPLRNILFAIAATLVREKASIRVICFRERFHNGRQLIHHSLALHIELIAVEPKALTQFVGWEKCENQLKPRMIDLSTSMDPIKLAESAVDLNLKLMKWRLMPELKLDAIRNTKCLLVGAGTLGCNVARQLMAWGVRHITFVDNATVSMSNPVRQSLFTFDAAKNKLPKSQAAASALFEIFPGVFAQGVQLDIPMPGHPISKHTIRDFSSYPQTLDVDPNCLQLSSAILVAYTTCYRLKELISSHDIVFLLTDTRESRWLPTVLSNMCNKLVINVALGFDTYLVMRHGLSVKKSVIGEYALESCNDLAVGRYVSGSNLGCYFCNDVVGPTNSLHNRAMDQQCTVTRPGVSMIAAALSVELLVSVIQHPKGADAPAPVDCDAQSELSSLPGFSVLIPHQIRGFLSHYSHILPTTSSFGNCSACSSFVLDAVRRDGFCFLLQVFNDADYLEQVCGLSDLRKITEDDAIIIMSDEEQPEFSLP